MLFEPIEIVNIVLIAGVLISYPFLILYKKSFMYELINERFLEVWSDESKTGARQFANISAVLAAISLATVPFTWSILPEEKHLDIVSIMGIAGILSSSVLFFWALGFSYNAGVASKPKVSDSRKIPQKSYKAGYYLGSFGVFLFFAGLTWTLNSVNPMLTTISTGMYFVILVIAYVIFRRS